MTGRMQRILQSPKIAGQFLGEGGILINIPYLSAETILAKLNETTKLREELQALRGDLKLSGPNHPLCSSFSAP